MNDKNDDTKTLARIEEILGDYAWARCRSAEEAYAREADKTGVGTVFVYLAVFLVMAALVALFAPLSFSVIIAGIITFGLAHLSKLQRSRDPYAQGGSSGAERFARMEASYRSGAKIPAKVVFRIITSKNFYVEDLGTQKKLWTGEKNQLGGVPDGDSIELDNEVVDALGRDADLHALMVGKG